MLSYLLKMNIKETVKTGKWLIRNRNTTLLYILKHLLKQLIIRNIPENINFARDFNNPCFAYKIEDRTLEYSTDPFANELLTNLLYTSLPEYLRYEDRNSMAYSTESRLPFLDYRLVEWAVSLPNELKINEGTNKRIVRESVKSYTPNSIIERKDKMGFVSPQEVWQKSVMKDLMTDLIKGGWEIPFLKRKEVINGFDTYLMGKDDNWSFWWRIFSYIYWTNNTALESV